MMPQLFSEEIYFKHVGLLNKLYGCAFPTDKYVCPICMREFDRNQLSVEHCPPKSIGGHKLAYTCRECNNNAGKDYEAAFSQGIKNVIEHQNNTFLEPKRVLLNVNGDTVNACLMRDGEDYSIGISGNNNNPQAVNRVIPQLGPNVEASYKVIGKDISPEQINAAILKTAYIMIFATLGYTVLKDSKFDLVRAQLLDCNREIVPRLWTTQHGDYPNGVFRNADDETIKYLMVCFNAEYPKNDRYHTTIAVALPTRRYSYEQLRSYLESKSGQPFHLLSFGEGCLTDEEKIKQIHTWYYS